MAILIKSMDMPTECEYCGFCRYYPENGNVWCNARNRLLKMNWENPHWTHLDVKRPDWCPLEALPSAQPDLGKYEYHYDHTDCIWYRPEARNRCPSTCAQYRDGWNDAMNYIFRDGKGYRPYRRDRRYEDGDSN